MSAFSIGMEPPNVLEPGPRIVRRRTRRIARRQTSSLVGAAAAVAALIALGVRLSRDEPAWIDRRVRERASRRPLLRRAMAPLFPVGMPGVYITAAHLLDLWLRQRGQRTRHALGATAWTAFVAHKVATLARPRVRPPRGRETHGPDSYPSGHTTGTTAVAVAVARVLSDRGMLRRDEAAALAWGAPLLMGAYRVIDDEHWLTDVVGGWLLGAATAVVCTALIDPVDAAPVE